MTDDARVLKATTEAAFLLLRAHSRARASLVVSPSPRGEAVLLRRVIRPRSLIYASGFLLERRRYGIALAYLSPEYSINI